MPYANAAIPHMQQGDEMDDTEPMAKRRKRAGRGALLDEDEDDGAAAAAPPPSHAPPPMAGMAPSTHAPAHFADPSVAAAAAAAAVAAAQQQQQQQHHQQQQQQQQQADQARRLSHARLGGLAPVPGAVKLHAGGAAPAAAAFRSIGAAAHHPHPLPTATHGPNTIAALAAAYGPGGGVPAGYAPHPGMAVNVGVNPAAMGMGHHPHMGMGVGHPQMGMGHPPHMGNMGVGMNPMAAGMGNMGMMQAAPGMMQQQQVQQQVQAQQQQAGGMWVRPGGFMSELLSDDGPSPGPVLGARRGRPPGGFMAALQDSDDDEDVAPGGKANADAAETVLQRVENISRCLTGAMATIKQHQEILEAGGAAGLAAANGAGAGGSAGGAGGSGAGTLNSPLGQHLVTQAEIARAIGSEAVAARLKPYQLVGINYLLQLARGRVGGAILADEMGLGKTAQTCVYMACLRPLLSDPGPHLVVVPASLLENWQRELAAWSPNLKVVVYYGPSREATRHRIKRQWARLEAGQDPFAEEEEPEDQGHFVNVNADEGEAEPEPSEGGGSESEEDAAVDEDDYGGGVSGPKTSNSNIPGCGGLFDVMLTTYTLWERDGPNYAIDRAFLARWPWSHVIMDEAHALKNSASTRSRKLRKVASGAMTRVMLTGTPLQNDLLELHALLAFLLPKIFMDHSDGADALAAQHIFSQLRKVAQHPLLVRAKFTANDVTELAQLAATRGLFGGAPTVERCLQELSSYSDHMIHCFAMAHPKVLSRYILPQEAVLGSAKVRHLDALLPKLKENGSRVLLFSQWTTVLDLLEWYLHLRGYFYCRLDGSTQVEDRLALVDAFNAPNSPYFIFLLSTRAGGQGLNLTGADTVILHDVDFNPQIDRQAEDRAHRLGQTRTVTVYRFITRGTVDATIQAIAERKLALDAAVLGDMTVGAGAEGGGRGRGRGRGRGANAASSAEVRHMAEILSSLLTGPAGSGSDGGAANGDGSADPPIEVE
ncbi:hypothetical protein GPECTOR_34g743 [Gonium pectorale]|uniref:Uncharacterized protein n=1 Tax=Gonium pectorale TaxID=33097 RepID=A0A150GCL2_GONPE|nr:hypothetical protein GPECTOR_34g743 [Gonium pectorale]|eukprot:KXZ47584.1 hypothetical protein GPECTOR_34g743 [Gonium pectorale]